jgi:ferredoxin like protein
VNPIGIFKEGAMLVDSDSVKAEDTLYQNRSKVDAGNPHVGIVPHMVPSEAVRTLVKACPAGCCCQRPDNGTVEVVPDGCMERGPWRVRTAESSDLDQNCPGGGCGIQFKF